MNRTLSRSIVGAGALASVLFATEARATDFQLALGASALGTDWEGDAAGYGSLKLGFRFVDIVGIYALGRSGYGAVDDRLLTQLSLGAQLWAHLGPVWPYARLGFLHQHEESLSVVAGDYGSALFGVGDGIRHRAGGELAIGLDVPFWQRDDLSLFAGGEACAFLFPDGIGPTVYAGASLSIGLSYEL
jgi:hypothetical protein